ncbi:extracellular solute-binding protein [Kribbella sp. NPDC059898]|uniref:extracellular solute-binding protein n=1 Tax=Kribbella sp. NPDC059898 TaxID=3346995 RepID=UPI00364C5262
MNALPRRQTLGGLLVAGTVLLAGACGFSTTSSVAGNNAGVPEKVSKPTTISFWHVYTGGDGAALDLLVKKFEAANPNIQVQAQYVGGFNDLNKKVVSALQAGSPPDVAIAYPANVLEYGKSKRVLDLIPYADKAGVGLSNEDLADIQPSELKRNRYSTQKGAYLSFPFAVNVAVLYYNADLLAQAGSPGPPKTWADFERVCSAVKAIGKTCYSANANASTLNAIGYSYGTTPVTTDGKASFDTPQWKEAFGMLGRLASSGTTRLASTGDAQTVDQNEFVSGQAAFIIRSSRSAPFLNKAVAGRFKWSAASLPQATSTGRPTTALYGPGLTAFTSDADRQLASWQLIKFLASADAQAAWAESTGNLPIRHSVLTAPAYVAYQKQHAATAVSAGLVADAQWEGALGDRGIVAFLPQKLRNSMEDLEGGVLSGALTPDAAQSQLQAQATQLMTAR